MDKSQLVRARDVARLLHIVHELDELPAEPAVRMRHVAERLCRFWTAKFGAVGFGEGFAPGDRPRFTSAVGAGSIDPAEYAIFVRYASGDVTVDPCIPLMAADERAAFARRRVELVPDKQWYATPHVADDRRGAGVDDVIYSMRRLPRRGSLQSIAIHRQWGDRCRFTERDRTLLRLIHMGVAPKLAPPRPPSRTQRLARELSPRLRETLRHMLRGESEKQIASRFGLSRHTVHGYVKAIYAHFDVASRAELLARWFNPADEPGGDGPPV